MTHPAIASAVFDLEAYLAGFGAEPSREDEWVLECPRCGKPKLSVNLDKRVWHCWVCEASPGGAGDVPALISLMEGLNRHDAIQKMVTETAAPMEELPELRLQFRSPAATIEELVPQEILPPPGAIAVDGTLPYLHYRGIGPQQIQERRLLWCPVGRYANRVVFPCWGEKGELVYWQARAMWAPLVPGERKTLNPRGVGAGQVLYGLELAQEHQRVVVVEGPIDAIRTGTDAVASLGKRLTSAQVALLLRAGVREVDLMWDGPSPTEPQGAWPDMLRTARELVGLFAKVRLVRLPAGDPADHTTEAVDYYRAHCAVEYGQARTLERI